MQKNLDDNIHEMLIVHEKSWILTSGRKFFYRLPPSHYHTLMIHSDVLVFHEITNGPFLPEDTILADWAPEETDEDEVSQYMKLIANSIDENSKYE